MPLRGTNATTWVSSSAATIDIGLPAGSVAGDLAGVLVSNDAYSGSGNNCLFPTGWTVGFSTTYEDTFATKVLTTADVTPASGYPNGKISVTDLGLAPYNAIIMIAVCIGAPRVREIDGNTGGFIVPDFVSTSSSVAV